MRGAAVEWPQAQPAHPVVPLSRRVHWPCSSDRAPLLPPVCGLPHPPHKAAQPGWRPVAACRCQSLRRYYRFSSLTKGASAVDQSWGEQGQPRSPRQSGHCDRHVKPPDAHLSLFPLVICTAVATAGPIPTAHPRSIRSAQAGSSALRNDLASWQVKRARAHFPSLGPIAAPSPGQNVAQEPPLAVPTDRPHGAAPTAPTVRLVPVQAGALQSVRC